MLLFALFVIVVCLHFQQVWQYLLQLCIQLTIVLQVLRVNHPHAPIDRILDRLVQWPVELFFQSRLCWENHYTEILVTLACAIIILKRT
jgi:hypothetical protein